MLISNIKKFPVVSNVCEQVLREIEKQPNWSTAYVIMNPLASSRLHRHQQMTEIYVITKGFGLLKLGDGGAHYVAAGSMFAIPVNLPHVLVNKSAGHLEHFVFAFPPFDSSDVYMVDEEKYYTQDIYTLSLPQPQECFDGAKIISYEFPDLDISIAFGWVINGPNRRKKPHYHKNTREFVYVVEGEGYIETNSACRPFRPVKSGDWICIESGETHGFLNKSPEDLVVVCVCFPVFKMEDVRYCP